MLYADQHCVAMLYGADQHFFCVVCRKLLINTVLLCLYVGQHCFCVVCPQEVADQHCCCIMCRKLLINTVLLCAAAEEGDQEEAERLLLATPVSPNARGLKHKNALHLAASKGHREIVEILLLNGVCRKLDKGWGFRLEGYPPAQMGGYGME